MESKENKESDAESSLEQQRVLLTERFETLNQSGSSDSSTERDQKLRQRLFLLEQQIKLDELEATLAHERAVKAHVEAQLDLYFRLKRQKEGSQRVIGSLEHSERSESLGLRTAVVDGHNRSTSVKEEAAALVSESIKSFEHQLEQLKMQVLGKEEEVKLRDQQIQVLQTRLSQLEKQQTKGAEKKETPLAPVSEENESRSREAEGLRDKVKSCRVLFGKNSRLIDWWTG